MVMPVCGRPRNNEAQATGHPEMQDQPASPRCALAIKKQILAATQNGANSQAG